MVTSPSPPRPESAGLVQLSSSAPGPETLAVSPSGADGKTAGSTMMPASGLGRLVPAAFSTDTRKY